MKDEIMRLTLRTVDESLGCRTSLFWEDRCFYGGYLLIIALNAVYYALYIWPLFALSAGQFLRMSLKW